MNLDELEGELMAALRPVAAPAGLADAVMARVAREAPRGRVLAWRRVAWLAVAACLLAGALGEGVHVRREREQAEAERQWALAEVLTGRALEQARGQLARAGIRLDGGRP